MKVLSEIVATQQLNADTGYARVVYHRPDVIDIVQCLSRGFNVPDEIAFSWVPNIADSDLLKAA
ncbi:hypothetical protein [Methylotenera sp.]|uniref:hypothetical protein n=1 Tax=Methylotenera sp. TaxID=2051956 RepID=UPI0027367340|nr:hypothetical protein [Methylotenera sp.]MDP3308296.1 hypothetical protein [Methylotenera sp.]